MLVGSEFEMAKKMGLFDDLFRNIMLIAIGYTTYGGITLSSSPIFLAISNSLPTSIYDAKAIKPYRPAFPFL